MSLFLISTAVAVPLTEEENNHLQASCGSRQLPSRARRSMNTPEATRREGPWSVALKYASFLEDDMDLFNSSEVICTGTLISSRHVLTAAHCVDRVFDFDCTNNKTIAADYDVVESEASLENYLVVAPEVCIWENCTTEFKPKPRGIKIKKITLSREYILSKCYNVHFNFWQGDAAIIELENDIEFSDLVQPACLSTKNLDPATDLVMFGFGTAMLIATEYNYTVLKTPAGILRKLETATKEKCSLNSANHENLICSSDVKSLACGGDSGSGQITFREDGKADVAGILVAGTYCWVAFDRFTRGENIDAEDINVIVSRQNWWICQATGICPGNARDQAVFEREKLESVLSELRKLGHPDTELAYRRPVDIVYDLMQ